MRKIKFYARTKDTGKMLPSAPLARAIEALKGRRFRRQTSMSNLIRVLADNNAHTTPGQKTEAGVIELPITRVLTATWAEYEAGAETGWVWNINSESDRRVKIHLPLKPGWYLPGDRFGIPNGEKSSPGDPNARFFLRYGNSAHNGPIWLEDAFVWGRGSGCVFSATKAPRDLEGIMEVAQGEVAAPQVGVPGLAGFTDPRQLMHETAQLRRLAKELKPLYEHLTGLGGVLGETMRIMLGYAERMEQTGKGHCMLDYGSDGE